MGTSEGTEVVVPLNKDGGLTRQEIEEELKLFFHEGINDPAVREDAEAAGVELERIASQEVGVRVSSADAGLTGIEEAIVLHLAMSGAEKLIVKVIIPWIKRRRGQGSVGKPEPSG